MKFSLYFYYYGIRVLLSGMGQWCTQTKLGLHTALLACACSKNRERRKSSCEYMSGHGCSLPCPSLIEFYYILSLSLCENSELRQCLNAVRVLWQKGWLFLINKSTAHIVFLLRKRYGLKTVSEINLTGRCPFKKEQTFVIFFMLQQELYDNSEDSCPIHLCSPGAVPHSAIRPRCTQVSGLYSGSAVNKACPSWAALPREVMPNDAVTSSSTLLARLWHKWAHSSQEG